MKIASRPPYFTRILVYLPLFHFLSIYLSLSLSMSLHPHLHIRPPLLPPPQRPPDVVWNHAQASARMSLHNACIAAHLQRRDAAQAMSALNDIMAGDEVTPDAATFELLFTHAVNDVCAGGDGGGGGGGGGAGGESASGSETVAAAIEVWQRMSGERAPGHSLRLPPPSPLSSGSSGGIDASVAVPTLLPALRVRRAPAATTGTPKGDEWSTPVFSFADASSSKSSRSSGANGNNGTGSGSASVVDAHDEDAEALQLRPTAACVEQFLRLLAHEAGRAWAQAGADASEARHAYHQYVRQCVEARQRWAAQNQAAAAAEMPASDASPSSTSPSSSISSTSSSPASAFPLPAAPPALAAVRRAVASALLQSARVVHPAYLSSHGIRTAPTALMVAHWIRHGYWWSENGREGKGP